MTDIIVGLVFFTALILLVLIAILVVVCCLYASVKADRKARILFEEYIKDENII